MASLCEVVFVCGANAKGINQSDCSGFEAGMREGIKTTHCKHNVWERDADMCLNVKAQEETVKNGKTCRTCLHFQVELFQTAPNVPPQIKMYCKEKKIEKFSLCESHTEKPKTETE